jgi:hypothetical protein
MEFPLLIAIGQKTWLPWAILVSNQNQNQIKSKSFI